LQYEFKLPAAMPVIVGLGNPGKKYASTRHNIGFELINSLADSLSVQLKSGRGAYITGKATHPHQRIRLAKPTTYMNDSGLAVQQLLQWYNIEPEQCLVCYDDINLETGVIRLRRGGSPGGHNGIKDIIQKLGTDRFPRLRIGIGRDFNEGRQVQYVLSPFSAKERKILDPAIAKASDAVMTFVEDDIELAMNNFN
jgi:PTH1 family peptidyl-tRNA hydrolase